MQIRCGRMTVDQREREMNQKHLYYAIVLVCQSYLYDFRCTDGPN